jgi:hypothetical protein
LALTEISVTSPISGDKYERDVPPLTAMSSSHRASEMVFIEPDGFFDLLHIGF